ncbi:MAG: cofactor-independent phosphoglycerate mutase [Proteobacteria bacterium]|nr:MAG: cofactor-independent phosphoglycerate mutase [Pseudomonadota bacterium]
MKYLILVGDGMGDHPIPELDDKTVIEAAKTPTINRFCREGELFLAGTVPDHLPPGSDVANLSLLGYDPARYYTGRAPLEAASMGIKLAEDDTAFRCNMVTLKHHSDGRVTMVDFAAGHITSEESEQLIRSLQEECGSEWITFYPGVSYRNLTVVKGGYTDIRPVPPHDYIEKDVTEHWQRYMDDPQWNELLDSVGRVLKNHPVNIKRREAGKNPANMIWLWGEGKMPSAPTLEERFGITGTMISAVDLLKGIGVVSGLTVAEVEGATGYIDTNYKGKADAAIEALKTQDFVFVHLEGPDEAGHQGLVKDKIQAVEDLDEKIVKYITDHLEEQKEDYRVIVTMDHFTPIELRTHTREPVPVVLYDSRGTTNPAAVNYSEKNGRIMDRERNNTLPEGYTLIDKLLQQ